MLKPIRERLNIREGEVALFGCAMLLFFLIRSSGILLNNYAETAFLKRFGVEYLPVITALNAVVTFVAMGYLAERSRGVAGSRVLSISLLTCAASVLLCRLAMPLGIPLLYPLLYVLKTQFEALLVFFFWNWANDAFDTRQSKRLFPLITSGGLLGSVFSSVLTPHAARWLSSDNLLFAYVVLAVCGALAAHRTGVRFPTALTAERPRQSRGSVRSALAEFGEVLPFVRRSLLAKILLLVTLVPNIAIPIVTYQFSFVVDQTYATEGGMIGFYGYFRGVQYSVSLLLSLVAGRLYSRFGIPVALMFHPFNYIIAATAYLLQFNIFSAMYATLSAGVLRSAINTPAISVLYGLFPKDRRAAVRAFLRGTVVRLGILSGSAVVLLSQDLIHPRYLSLGVLLLGVLWLGSVFLLKRNYTAILVDLVRSETLDVGALEASTASEVFRDRSCWQPLLQTFRTARGENAVWYGGVLRDLGDADLDGEILAKLEQEDDATRIRLLKLLSPAVGTEALPVFRRMIDPERPELMVALARTGKRIFPRVRPERRREIYDTAAIPEVKACFLPGLVPEDPPLYEGVIDRWLGSADLAERRAGVLAARAVANPARTARLVGMLGEETDPALLSLLLRVLGELQPSALSDQVGPFLRHSAPTVRQAALDVVVVEDESTARSVVALLGDPWDATRERAIAKLEDTSYPVGPLLVEALGTHSRRVQDAVFRIGESMRLPDGVAIQFYQGQLRLAQSHLEAAGTLRSLPQRPARDQLIEHLVEQQQARVRNVLRGLAAFDRTGGMRVAYRGITSGDLRRRANGIEALESVLDNSLAATLIPLVEEWGTPVPPADEVRTADNHATAHAHGVLRSLLDEPDWVTRLLALHLIRHEETGALHTTQFQTLVEGAEGATCREARMLSIAPQLYPGKEGEMDNPLVDVPHRILWLRKIRLFATLTIGELAAVAQVLGEERYLAGETVARAGEIGHRLRLVVEGQISIRRDPGGDSEGREFLRVESGECFGEATLFTDAPPFVSIQAVTDCHLLILEKEEFEAVVREYPEVALGVCRHLSERLVGVLHGMERGGAAADQDVPGSMGNPE